MQWCRRGRASRFGRGRTRGGLSTTKPRESGDETQSADGQHTPRIGAELDLDVGVRVQEQDRGVTQLVKEHCERVTDDYRYKEAAPVVETVSGADFDR